MGGFDLSVSAAREPLLKYHPCTNRLLTLTREAGQGTVLSGQFDWGGLLLKSNGGAQRLVQRGWKPRVECKSISQLYCESDRTSSYESRF